MVSSRCIRQKCIAMSSTEAELVALAECAIELVHIIGLCRFLGLEIDEAVEVETSTQVHVSRSNMCTVFCSSRPSPMPPIR